MKEAGFDPATTGFTWMDATVGAMLDKLDKLGIADNTLFVFVSDPVNPPLHVSRMSMAANEDQHG